MGNRDLVRDSSLADIALGNPSDDSGDADAPDVFASFIQDARLRGCGATPSEASDIDERARSIYSDIAERANGATQKATAPAAEDLNALQKRFMGQPRCRDKRTVRIEKSENGRWLMEYDERGEMIAGHCWGYWPEEQGEASL
jgi:hypothetical protein